METISPASVMGAVPVPLPLEEEVQPSAPPITLEIVEAHTDLIVEMFGEAFVREMLAVAKKVCRDAIRAATTKKEIIEQATTIARIDDRIRASADRSAHLATPGADVLDSLRPAEPEDECPPWCHNPYCDCRN